MNLLYWEFEFQGNNVGGNELVNGELVGKMNE